MKRFLIRLCCYVLLFTACGFLTLGWTKRSTAAAACAYGMDNAKQIASALKEFESDYGRFPDESTVKQITAFLAPNHIEIQNDLETHSSNARFRQLIESGITSNEDIFYSVTTNTYHYTDGDISKGNAISPGECGFAYVDHVRTDDKIPRPIAIAPASFTNGVFIYDAFRGKAVVVWTDGSVSSLPIDRSTNHVMLDGKNLFDPMHPIWGDVKPKLLMPER